MTAAAPAMPMPQSQPPSRVMTRRMRALSILAAATALAVVAAAAAVLTTRQAVAPQFAPEPFFPGLSQRLDEAAAIAIEGPSGAFEVVRNADGRWTLPGKGGYPAKFDNVRQLGLGLAELQKAEPKTARPEWHAQLELANPGEDGAGTRIVLKNAAGGDIAALIAGKVLERPSTAGRGALYVRAPGENQTWLARGPLAVEADQANWLERSIVTIDRTRLRSATLRPFEGPEYTVLRDAPEDQAYRLAAVPEGRQARPADALAGVAHMIANVTLEDVRPQAEIDWSNAAHAVFASFDGVNLVAEIVRRDDGTWVKLQALPGEPYAPPAPEAPDGAPAQSVPAAPLPYDAKAEAARINAVAMGWAYKVPEYIGAQLTAPLESLLVPQDEAAPAEQHETVPAPQP